MINKKIEAGNINVQVREEEWSNLFHRIAVGLNVELAAL